MKSVLALALAGSALAGSYGAPASQEAAPVVPSKDSGYVVPKPSSTPADPVVPSKGGYGGEWPETSSTPAAPVIPSKGGYGGDVPKSSSTPAAPVIPSKGGYGGDWSETSSTPAAPVIPSKGGYGGDWPKSSSTPAAPVIPSKGGYGGDWPKSSSAASVSAKPSGTWDEDDEDCDEDDGEWDDEDDSTYSKKASSPAAAVPTWSKKAYGGGEWDDDSHYTKTWDEVIETAIVKTTTSTDSWGKAYPTEVTVTVKATRTNVATITKSKAAVASAPVVGSASVVAWATPAYFDTLACCKTVVTVTEYVKDYKPTASAPAAPSWSSVYSVPVAPELPSKPDYSKADYTPKADYTTTAAPSYTPKGDYDWTPAASSSTPAAPAVPSKPAYSGNSGNSPVVNNGNKWGMTYTPYTKDGQCKTADQVDADILKIKGFGFTTVRLYATDCDGLKNVGASTIKHDVKLIVGVFIDKKGLEASWDQVDEIAAWGKSTSWSNVVMVVVGNEAIFNGYCSGTELAAYISKVKAYLADNGYKGWTTTTEPTYIIEQEKDCLCSVVDVAAANVQPFFTSSIDAKSAGDFVLSQLAQVAAACPGKDAYNLECGWPSSGSNNGAAVPSKADQKTAILDIIAKAGQKTVIFSYEDDEWKEGGEFDVEKSWGCSDLFY